MVYHICMFENILKLASSNIELAFWVYLITYILSKYAPNPQNSFNNPTYMKVNI